MRHPTAEPQSAASDPLVIFAPFHLLAAGVGRLRRPAFDARASVELSRLGLPFFPVSRYALAPSAALVLVNEVLLNNRRSILELGSGYSTLCLAKAAERTDGHVVTVDSEESWLDQVTAAAAAAGLGQRITPVHSPLRPHASGGAWYDCGLIRRALAGRRVDLLLVDGPVASGGADPRARAPAVPELEDLLEDRCALFLDDIHRRSHAEIAREWGRRLRIPFTLVHARGGFGYGVRGAAFDPII